MSKPIAFGFKLLVLSFVFNFLGACSDAGQVGFNQIERTQANSTSLYSNKINSLNSGESNAALNSGDLSLALAQKIVLDLRFYCDEFHAPNKPCYKPMQQLPPALADMIAKANLGGVILFSENLNNTEQIVKLNHDLQNAAQKSSSQLPLLIAIDQEGGRVARLPRETSTAFSGNMAIGATYKNWGTKYAEIAGGVIGSELEASGFNVNFAPTLDVNSNPNNPVINVRSFSDDAEVVGKLGVSQLSAMQSHKVISTLKHFPGHGDTNVDSHTGLPVVNHSLDKVMAVDIAPFKYAIDNADVDMIMTAHIQYPQLDNSTFVSKSGKRMIKPATMSRAIISDLLRQQMKYKGLVITDALDMRGITEFFSETDAVIETFNAGVDIALMPIKIRNEKDITKLYELLNDLKQAVDDGRLNKTEISQSFHRIKALKQQKLVSSDVNVPLSQKLSTAKKVLAKAEHKKLEQELSDRSITLIKGQGRLPSSVNNLLAFMPDENKCEALGNGLSKGKSNINLTCYAYYDISLADAKRLVIKTDALLLTSITPQQSLAEMGGVEDLALLKSKIGNIYKDKRRQGYVIRQLLKHAKNNGVISTFVSLRMPYETQKYKNDAHNILTTFGYNQFRIQTSGSVEGVVYNTLSKVLLGKIKATGNLPIAL